MPTRQRPKTGAARKPVTKAKAVTAKVKAKAMPAIPYERTPKEQRAVEALKDQRAQRIGWTKIKVESEAGSGAKISAAHDDQQTAQALQAIALGVTSTGEIEYLLKDAINLTLRDQAIDAAAANEVLTMVSGLSPKSTVEAMLAMQMVAIHRATINMALRLRSTADLTQHTLFSKALNNLSNTFGRHADTLKKLQGAGEQKVVVEHRHYHLAAGAIAPGGNAVLGDVEAGAGGVQKQLESQPHER
jgi:hypothetical protein